MFIWTIKFMTAIFCLWLLAYGLAKVIQVFLDRRHARIHRRYYL